MLNSQGILAASKCSMDSSRQHNSLASDASREGVKFVQHELDMGFTFLQLAQDSQKRGHPENVARQRAITKEALETALKFLPAENPTPAEKADIEAKIAELESKLAEI